MPNLTRLEMSVKKCTNQPRKKHNRLRENDKTIEKSDKGHDNISNADNIQERRLTLC